MSEYNDHELLEMFRDESKTNFAFNLLVRKYQERLYWHIRKIVIDHDDADDVLQNTFIKVFKSLKRFNQRSKFSTWIFRVAYNQALDQYRKRSKRGEVELSEEGGSEKLRSSNQELFQDISRRELSNKIYEALELLPLKLRTAVVLKYIEGLSYSEICSIVGCASPTGIGSDFFKVIASLSGSNLFALGFWTAKVSTSTKSNDLKSSGILFS